MLKETLEDARTGWVFKPASLQTKSGRKPRGTRPNAEWVGKVISRIGEKAGVVVRRDGDVTKFASAHDLRRSLAERLLHAGVPERVVSTVMRHASPQTTQRYYAPCNVQHSARVLRKCATGSETRETSANLNR
jgi:integrase